MYCTNCGKQLPEGCTDTLCDDCKAAATEQPATTATAQQATASTAPQTQQTTAQQAYSQPYAQQSNVNYQPQQPVYNSRMYGFGPALTSTILSIFGFIFACVCLGWYSGLTTTYSSYVNLYGYSSSAAYETLSDIRSMAGVGVVFIIIALGFTIPSLILGINSIKKFTAARKAHGVTPIPALVLGIIGTVYAALSLLFVVISFFMMVTVL